MPKLISLYQPAFSAMDFGKNYKNQTPHPLRDSFGVGPSATTTRFNSTVDAQLNSKVWNSIQVGTFAEYQIILQSLTSAIVWSGAKKYAKAD